MKKNEKVDGFIIINKTDIVLIFLIFLGSGILLPIHPVAAETSESKKMTMTFTRPKTESYGKWMFLVFDEAFRRMGMELVYKHYPPKRGSFLANEGMVDGELGRVHSYNKDHPDLIRVEEPIASISWAAYTTSPTIRVNGWDDLKGTSLKVEYRAGLAEAHQRLSTRVSKQNLSSIKNVLQGLNKLAIGRTDLYVGVKETVMPHLTSDEFADSQIRIAGLLEEETLHAFLHIKHKSIAPKLSGVLKQMKEEGLLAEYRIIIQSE